MLSLLNNSERMLLIFIYESSFIFNARNFSKNISRMINELTFYIRIKSVIRMISFFFTNYTIIFFIRIIFTCIREF
jgi:hypothetical protein